VLHNVANIPSEEGPDKLKSFTHAVLTDTPHLWKQVHKKFALKTGECLPHVPDIKAYEDIM
jgi:hypothetical protein